MAISASYIRLEPRPYQRNFEAGLSAAIHDPLWFLARQWQMGEHQGENASSPIWIDYSLQSRKIKFKDERFDPQVIPAEALVESELLDWWTMGRRIRIGKRLEAHPSVKDNAKVLFADPPPPYEHFRGRVDGLAVWQQRAELGIANNAFGTEIPADSIPAWNDRELLYQQTNDNSFKCDQKNLVVNRHHGGRLDWYSVDTTPGPTDTGTVEDDGKAIPTTFQYPGAPNSRWWEIESSEVDLGGYAPDSAHTGTAMLTDLIFSHSDDWFLFPVVAKAGHIVAIDKLEVSDTFGRKYNNTERGDDNELLWPGLQPPDEWTLFQVSGLKPNELLLWHVAELPLEGMTLEKVQFGLDEQSNLLWAVERVLDGRDVASSNSDKLDVSDKKFNSGNPKGSVLPSDEVEYAYVPAKGVVPHWHPYIINEEGDVRSLIQQSLPDLSLQRPKIMPLPKAELLGAEQKHSINPLAIPSNGIELERRRQLARDMHGNPVMWIQRKRSPLLSPPSRLLRFDVMEEARFEAP
jgi:hypothetical protein